MFRTAFLNINIILFLVLLASCAAKKQQTALPYYNTPDFTPYFIKNKTEVSQKINHSISNFSFTDQYGKQITQKDIEEKIHVADFIFTSCGSICPVLTSHLKLVQDAFSNNSNVVILSYSVTPWIDSAARLKKYAQNNNIVSPNWHLLTGNKNEIYSLARTSYFAEEDLGFTKDSSDFLHTEHILLVDGNKKIRGIYNGTLQLDIEQMIKDIDALLKEKDQ